MRHSPLHALNNCHVLFLISDYVGIRLRLRGRHIMSPLFQIPIQRKCSGQASLPVNKSGAEAGMTR
jgi:hypothetical protein